MSHKTECHCGAVKIEMRQDIERLTQCNCSICRRYGVLWAYQPRKDVTITAEAGSLKPYKWSDENIDFFHCTNCGCVTHYELSERQPDGSDVCAVNMRNTVDPLSISKLPVRLFDGADSWKAVGEQVIPHLLALPTNE